MTQKPDVNLGSLSLKKRNRVKSMPNYRLGGEFPSSSESLTVPSSTASNLKKKAPSGTKRSYLSIEQIRIPNDHRPVDKSILAGLIESIQKVGLQYPITVKQIGEGLYELVAGRHRLEAFRAMGRLKIRTLVMSQSKATSFWASSENVHRSDLTPLQRSEEIAKLAVLAAEDGPPAHPRRGGKQPTDRQNSSLGLSLNMDRRQVREAKKFAAISKKAKQLLTSNGLDKKFVNLKTVAKGLTEADQVRRVKALIDRKSTPNAKKHRVRTKAISKIVMAFQYSDLISAWDKFRQRYESKHPSVRQRFKQSIKL